MIEELSALKARHPDWGPWLGVVEVTLGEIRESAWRQAVICGKEDSDLARLAPQRRAGGLPATGQLKAFLDRLIRAAVEAPRLRALVYARYREGDVRDIFIAALHGDERCLNELAVRIHTEPAALQAVAALLPVPWLQAYRSHQAAHVPNAWREGYCPCCGAWPALATICGIDRVRYLECGRCGCHWETEALRCPYCGTRDHDKLGLLMPEGSAEGSRIEVCKACEGYIKVLRALGPGVPENALIADLASIELDLAAATLGYRRPKGVGCRIEWVD